MSRVLERSVLKGVSRSFYLSLRLLPEQMRGGTSLAYLLARTSDTIADTEAVSPEERLSFLQEFQHAVKGEAALASWPRVLRNGCSEKEAVLLGKSHELLHWLRRLPAGEEKLVREVVSTIISGQTLDLQKFSEGTAQRPVALQSAGELEDYAYRVAGSVGEFWTKLGLLTLGNRFSIAPYEQLLRQGSAYGKGLQIVNILRDLRQDLLAGRCYLPAGNHHDIADLMHSYSQWHKQAGHWISEGMAYAKTVRNWRVRAATILPGLLAEKTLARLQHVTFSELETRIKIPRQQVYCSLMKSIFYISESSKSHGR